MILTKPIQKVTQLPLMEDFYSIQGEGFYQGHPAYFIRLGGCDVGCIWCDVKESWIAENHPVVAVDELVIRAKNSGSKLAVVTGGEPAMYNLDYLTTEIRNAGMRTHLETSGVYPLTGQWDWICFSPKKFKTPVPSLISLANELKVVVYHESDLAWAEEYASQVNDDCHLFLQPEWSKEKSMLALIIDYVKNNSQWKISLQIHKYMNVR